MFRRDRFFISYDASSCLEIAVALQRECESWGARCYLLDVATPIKSTAVLFARIERLISKSDCVLAVLDGEDAPSNWVATEVAIARTKKKPLLFVFKSSEPSIPGSVCEGYPVITSDDRHWRARVSSYLGTVRHHKSRRRVLALLVSTAVIYSTYHAAIEIGGDQALSSVILRAIVIAIYVGGARLVSVSDYMYKWRTGRVFTYATDGDIVGNVTSNSAQMPEPGYHRKLNNAMYYSGISAAALIVVYLVFVEFLEIIALSPAAKDALFSSFLVIPLYANYHFRKYRS